MRFKKGLIAIVLSLAMIITMLPAQQVMAAKAPKLNKTKVTLTVGKSTTLKVYNTKKKVKWSVNKKSIVKITSKGKVTAKKAGVAIVTARVGNKKLKCRITVKKKSTGTSNKTVTVNFDKPMQLSWDSMDARISPSKLSGFTGAVTAVFSFEHSTKVSGVDPEIYLRTGWSDGDIVGNKNFIRNSSQKSLTVKYTSSQVSKMKNAKDLAVYGVNLKIKSVKFTGSSKKFDYGYKGSPVDKNGALKVKGNGLVNQQGKQIMLKGTCVSGLTWHPDMISREIFKTVRDQWNANLIRLAMYVDTSNDSGINSQGYASGNDSDRANIKKMLYEGIDEASALGMYVLVDWHILRDQDPNRHIDQAKKFFAEVSKKYAKNKNIIYEICNEPNGDHVTWSRIKKYANTIIPIIKKNDPDAVIVVGTPSWSSQLDGPMKDPIKGYSNIMYAYHFYAATHKDEQRAHFSKAIKAGLPIFVTEFGLTEASGEGYIDYASGKKWFDIMSKNKISCAVWNLNSRDDVSGSKMSQYFKYIRDFYKKN